MPSRSRVRQLARGAYVATAVVDTCLAGSASPRAHRARRFTKPLLMPLLMASTLATPASAQRTAVLTAQACGWVGDVILLDDGDRALRAGAAAFGLGHLAYVGGFASAGAPPTPSALTLGSVASGIGTAVAVTSPLARPRRSAVDALTLSTYGLLLTQMAARAQDLGSSVPRRDARLVALGGALFAASDTTLMTRKVFLTEPAPWVEGLVMATYTAAQYLLSHAAVRSHP